MARTLELYIFGVAAAAGLLRILWSVSYSFTPWLMPWDLYIYPGSLILAAPLAWVIKRMVRQPIDRIYLLSTLIRFSLAFMMFLYGLSKVLLEQFALSYSDQDTRLLNASGAMKAWSFFGHSDAYQAFLGWGEVVGALLILFHATLPVGALLLTVMLVNIALANFTHDIGVRANSTLYLTQALLLLWPDRARIGQFVAGKFAEPRCLPEVASRWRAPLNLGRGLAALAIAAYAGFNQWMYRVHKPLPHPLVGIWRCEKPNRLLRLRFDDDRKGTVSTPTDDRQDMTFEYSAVTSDLKMRGSDSVYFDGQARLQDERTLVLSEPSGNAVYRRIRP